MSKENTFGDYKFLDWVPEHTQNLIVDFWGCFGRTSDDWIQNCKDGATSACNHGPGPNGFGNPPAGATADYILRDYKISKELGEDRFKIVRGRYIHHWNNIGSIVDDNGETHHVSSCDRWIRVWQCGEKEIIALN